MTTNECPCGEPALEQAILGRRCLDRLERDLGDIPALSDELDTTLARQSAGGRRVGGRSSEKPMPYDVGASEALSALRVVLVGWVRVLDLGETLPANTLPALALWLLARSQRAAHHEAGAEIADEVHAATQHARRSYARSTPSRLYAGRCGAVDPGTQSECQEGLYAAPGAAQTACRACGAEHEVAPRREWMRAAAEDALFTTPALVVAMAALHGADVSRARLQKWAQRGHLVPVSVNAMGHPLYRLGDVRELLAALDRGRVA